MALRSPSSTPRLDLGPRDSPPLDSPPPNSKGESSSGTKADAGWKMKEKVDHLLVKLEKEGVEIDGKIASIIDDGIARIKAEAAREEEDITEPKSNRKAILFTIASVALGFIMGAEWYEYAFRAANAKRRHALEEEVAKRRAK